MSPLDTDRLATLLWHASRTRRRIGGTEHRAAPSAGGLHAISTLVVSEHVELYDPMKHTLGALDGDLDTAELFAEARSVLPEANGTLLILVGDRERLDAQYSNPDSLLWRDAGCVIATYHLVATWLGMASCPLGILFSQVAQQIEPNRSLIGVGAVLVGETRSGAPSAHPV